MIHYEEREISVAHVKQLFTDTTELTGALVFTALFLFIVSWFHLTDVWNNHFFTRGPVYALYNGFKVIYLFYFVWFVYFAGRLIVRFIERRGNSFALGHLDTLLLSFYIGWAVLRLVMFILGYLNLYYFPVAVLITVPILVLSFPHLKEVFLSAMRKIRNSDKTGAKTYINLILGIAAVLVSVIVLVEHGLFPNWDNDVLGHYKQYYDEVIRNHGIWPNNVWYHYYYTKGAGLVFLTILLTDVHGAQLVSFSFFVISALTLFSLVEKISSDITWPLMAAIFYMLIFIGNPPNFDNAMFVGNPTPFAKQHMISAALTASLVWMVALYPTRPAATRKSWAYLIALLAASFIFFLSVSFYFISVFFGVFFVISLVMRNYKQARIFFFLTGSVLAAMLLNLAINYVTTGLAEATPFRVFWNLSNQEKFSQWFSPYASLYLLEGSSRSMGTYSTVSVDYGQWFIRIFRLHNARYFFLQSPNLIILLPLLIGLALIKGIRSKYNVIVVGSPVLVMIGVAAANGVVNNQPISLERYYIFTVFLVVIASVTVWRLFLDLVINPSFRYVAACLLIALVLVSAITDIYNQSNKELFKSQFRFALGQTSFKDAYKAVDCYWDDAAKIKEIAGMDTKVWTFLAWCGTGALPGQDFEYDVSYSYKDWHIMAFADPEQAKEAFKREGFNYFLLDIRAQNGAIPYSPLFAPDNIKKYFEIVAVRGDVFLLTWRGKSAHPVPWPGDFLQHWTSLVEKSNPNGLYALYRRVKSYYTKYDGRVYPVYLDATLPPVQGFQ